MKSREGHRPGAGLVSGALGLCLLIVLLLRLAFTQPAAAPPTQMAMPRPLPPNATPSQRTLWDARGWRHQALLAAESEREAQEAADPGPLTSVERMANRRRRLMAQDRRGYLARARSAAQRAAELARTPEEAARAASLRARLECYAGHHEAELQQAQRLVALAPQEQAAWMALRRAGQCTGQEALVRQADAKLAALAETVVTRYPASAFRRDGLEGETPALGYDEW